MSANGGPAAAEGRSSSSSHKWLATGKSQVESAHRSQSPSKGGNSASEVIVLSDSGCSAPPSPSAGAGEVASATDAGVENPSAAMKRKMVASQVVFSDRRLLEKRPRLQHSPSPTSSPSPDKSADESARPKQETNQATLKTDMTDGPPPPVSSFAFSSASTLASPDSKSARLESSTEATATETKRSAKFRVPRGIHMDVEDVKQTVLELHRTKEAGSRAPESDAAATPSSTQPILSEIEQLRSEKKSIALRDKVRYSLFKRSILYNTDNTDTFHFIY